VDSEEVHHCNYFEHQLPHHSSSNPLYYNTLSSLPSIINNGLIYTTVDEHVVLLIEMIWGG